jgi:hypothetical protein
MRVSMAQRIHRHAAGEIEIAVAIGRDQPNGPSPRSKATSARAKTGNM